MKIEKIERMDTFSLHMLSKVGSQIKIARERRGLNYEKMGEICFCDVKTIKKIESGDSTI